MFKNSNLYYYENFFSLLLSLIVLLPSCSKTTTTESLEDYEKLKLSNEFTPKTGTVVYSIQTCLTETGDCGAQCAITQKDDDCCLQTPCKPGENFNSVLNQKYTPQQIDDMTKNPTRITDPDLIEALRKDGVCLK